MAYKRIKWLDHIVQRPRTYRVTKNTDGTETLAPAPGTIIQQGTAQSANNFNNAEEGLQHYAAAFDWLSTIVSALNMKIEKILGQQSNENLIENAWFQVNQKGETTYTAYGYTVDRWILNTHTGTLSVNNDGVSLSAGSGNAYYESFNSELFEKIKGKTVTYSIALQNGEIVSGTGKVPTTPVESNIIVITGKMPHGAGCGVYINSAGQLFVQFGVSAGYSVSVRAVKLEIGTVSTLYKDQKPDYAYDFDICQRKYVYYRYYAATGWLTGGSRNLQIPITLPKKTANGIAISVKLKQIAEVRHTGGYANNNAGAINISSVATTYTQSGMQRIMLLVNLGATMSPPANNTIIGAIITDLEIFQE